MLNLEQQLQDHLKDQIHGWVALEQHDLRKQLIHF